EVAGRDLARLSGRGLADHRLRTVGMVFQSFNLIAARTALENVELPLLFAGVPPAERRARAVAALEAVGVGYRVRRPPAGPAGRAGGGRGLRGARDSGAPAPAPR